MSGEHIGDKKTKGWFKGVLSTRNDLDNNNRENQNLSKEITLEQVTHNLTTPPAPSLSILEQDTLALALTVAVENILNDRQLVFTKSSDREVSLHIANENINRLRNEVSKKDHQMLEREKEIRSLEEKLTGKQMSYDQLLEDYKDYQSTTNMGTDNLKYQLEKERNKYLKMSEELTKLQYEAMKRTESFEEKIRDLEVENQQKTELNQKMGIEKANLLQSINDFTERMSFSFTQSDKKTVAPIPTLD